MDNDKFQELVLKQLTALNEGQKSLTCEAKSLQDGQISLGKGQKLLSDDVKILSEGQDVLRQNMARMEFQLMEKIDALSDGQQVLTEYQNNNDENIKFLVNTMDYIVNKIDHVAADTSLLVGRVTRLEKAK